MKKILYITVQAPYGRVEPFLIEEMLSIKDFGYSLLIVPVRPPNEVFHIKSKKLLSDTMKLPLINISMILKLFIFIFTKSLVFYKLFHSIYKNSPNIKTLCKNLAVLPKGIFLSYLIKKQNIEHIHAHWSSTSSTIAYIISQITKIPWSFTAHSGAILRNNMLKEKIRTAKFVRVISKNRYNDILNIVGKNYRYKIFVSHLGINVPNNKLIKNNLSNPIILACIGHLDKIKGHKYLVKACYFLKKYRFNFKCLLIGEGPEKNNLIKMVNDFKLQNNISFLGELPHENILEMMLKKEIDILIQPSITIKCENREEGIPVVLMEAMGNCIPVITTDTGSIPELVMGNGLLVPEKDSLAIVDSVKYIYYNYKNIKKVINRAYNIILNDFNINKNTKILIKLIEN